MKLFKTTLLVAATGLLMAGCGGGGSADTTPKASITSVKAFGDSLADSGTFGYKFTVQTANNLVYPERVAAAYGQTLCPYYMPTNQAGTAFAPSTATGCTNFAIGGGRINPAGVANPATNQQNIQRQLAEAAAKYGSYTATDMLIIDGGGNDAGDLIGAYLNIPKDGGATYTGLLATQGVTPTAATQAALAAAGATYMTALADTFAATITAQGLSKGATHVVVLNMPDVTLTPRFGFVLAGVAAASGGGTTGAAAAAQAQALFQSWISAFNTELNVKLGSNANVALVDFASNFTDEVTHPAQYNLSNSTTPACPIYNLDSNGLPTYDFPSCTGAYLSAHPPTGVTDPNWWMSYTFSDSFHPTPYGHQLLGQLISRTLAQKGWE